jgi:hypothetical protein
VSQSLQYSIAIEVIPMLRMFVSTVTIQRVDVCESGSRLPRGGPVIFTIRSWRLRDSTLYRAQDGIVARRLAASQITYRR